MKTRAYIPVLLAALILWAPLIEGSETHTGWVVNRLVVLALLLIGLWRASDRGAITVPYHWIIGAFTFLAIMLVIVTIRAVYSYPAILWLVNYAVIAVVMVAATRLSEEGEKWIIRALMLSAGVEALWGIIEYLAQLEPRSNGTFFNPNYFGEYLAAAAAILWSRVAFEKMSRKWPEALLLFLLVAGVVVSESRGAVLALFAGLVVVGMVRWGMKVFPALLVIVLPFLLIPNAFVERLETIGETDIYAWSRMDMWKNTLKMIVDHPIGIGIGLYRFYSPSYAFPVEKAFARYGQVAEWSHNAILDMAVELGPASLLLLLGIFAFLIKSGLDRARRYNDVMAIGAMGALVAVITHGCVDSIQKNPPADFIAAIFAGFLLSRSFVGVRMLSFAAPRRVKILIVSLGLAAAWVAIAPTLGFEFSQLAIKRNRMGDREGTFKWLRRALIATPGNADLWYQRGLLDASIWRNGHSEDRYGEALQSYDSAIKLNPLKGIYKIEMGDLILERSRLDKEKSPGTRQEVLELYRRAIKNEPFNPFYHVRVARLLIEMGDIKNAEEEYRRAIEIEPRYGAAMVQLGDLLAGQGKRSAAAIYYREALSVMEKPLPKPLTGYVRAMVDINLEEVKKALENVSGGAEN